MNAQTFTSTASLGQARYLHSATLLTNGTVLIVGGFGSNQNPLNSGETYSPSTGIFAATQGSLVTARAAHTAVLLSNGNVLIAGGEGPSNVLSSAEVYQASGSAVGNFMETGAMTTPRWQHTATLLSNGMVLVTGGLSGSGSNALSSAELYNPLNGTFTATGSMHSGRVGHTATLLSNGKVLIVGGNTGSTMSIASAEIYDPGTGTFTLTGSLATGRSEHAATLLGDGTVLISGGNTESGSGFTAFSSAELYNTVAGTFAATSGSMTIARYAHTATPLADGTILIAGGVPSYFNVSASAEIYSPSNKTFTATGSLHTARAFHTATPLSGTTVLVAGGETSSNGAISTAEIYSYALGSGTINPKYVVLGVVYAPPGAASNVSYSNSILVGTTTSLSSSISSGTTISASTDLTLGIFGTGGTNTYTASTSYTQESDQTSSVAVNETTSNALQAHGPLSSSIGVDHDYDQVLVWLNPIVNLSVTATPGTLLWNGYSYDQADPYFPNSLDVAEIAVYCLKNPYSTDPGCAQAEYVTRLRRSWDTSGVGGLTPADYAQILQADPFGTNPTYDPTAADSNGALRFDPEGTQSIPYQIPVGGGQPVTATGSLQYTATATAGQDATSTYQVGFTVKSGADESTILGSLSTSVTTSGMLTWVNKWGDLQTKTSTSSAAFSITGPSAADNYNGPEAFQVYKDNVYGTFMFYAPGFPPTNAGSITFSPSTLTFSPAIAVGGVSGPIQVTLTNDSSLPMKMESPAINFSDPSFSIVGGSDRCSGVTIPANGTCSISVQFSPVAAEVNATGTTTISGTIYATGLTDGIVLGTLPVSGTATPAGSGPIIPPASITFNVSSLAFTPAIPVGGVSNPLQVTLTNNSTESMAMQTPAVAFSDGSFTLVNGSDTCSGATLVANGTCTVSVQFSPIASEVNPTGTTPISGAMTASGMEIVPGVENVPITAQLPVSGTALPGSGEGAQLPRPWWSMVKSLSPPAWRHQKGSRFRTRESSMSRIQRTIVS